MQSAKVLERFIVQLRREGGRPAQMKLLRMLWAPLLDRSKKRGTLQRGSADIFAFSAFSVSVAAFLLASTEAQPAHVSRKLASPMRGILATGSPATMFAQGSSETSIVGTGLCVIQDHRFCLPSLSRCQEQHKKLVVTLRAPRTAPGLI